MESSRETSEERKRREQQEDDDFEKQFEHYCGRAITACMMFSPVWALLSFLGEWAMRVPMVVVEQDLAGLQVIVTGGCDGIGEGLTKLLVSMGAAVVLGCRDAERAESAVRRVRLETAGSSGTVAHMELDLASLASVRGFATQYESQVGRSRGLHVLVNNAGGLKACNATEDGHEVAFQTNYLGPYLLTELLLPTLKRSSPARIVHVSCQVFASVAR